MDTEKRPRGKGLPMMGQRRHPGDTPDPGPKHDHGHDHGHEHGEACGHDHGHKHDHDHGSHDAHEHGASCGHDHGHEHHGHDDHHGHEHAHGESCGHHHGPPEPQGPWLSGTRVAEDGGGGAYQFQLRMVLPGETDARGRFERLEHAIERVPGIRDVHLRVDGGLDEVCVHFQGELTGPKLEELVREASRTVRLRYHQETWFVHGMDAAQCATIIEHALERVPGVLQARVAYAAERLVVEFDSQMVKAPDIQTAVGALGYELELPQKGHACSSHAHAGGLAPMLEVPLAIAAGVLTGAGYALEASAGASAVSTGLYVVALVAGGFFPAKHALLSLGQLKLDIEALMVLAAVGAGVLGAWFEGAFLLFLFSLGHAFEHHALERARRAVDALGRLRPRIAHVRRESGVVDVPVGDVRAGEIVVVRPGDAIPLDGTIREGNTSVDQATLTGESVPVSKGPGDTVFAGTLNAEDAITIVVTRASSESALSKLIDLVMEAEAQKSPTQRFTQSVERRFVPVVLATAVVLPFVLLALGWGLRASLLKAVSLLVAASPCALAISTPAAVLAAVAAGARRGVLIKGGTHLETLGTLKTIAFDKTGTLTHGKPKLVAIAPEDGVTDTQLLQTAAAAECSSQHPLARAIVAEAAARGIKASDTGVCDAVHGKGLWVQVDGVRIGVGNMALYDGKVPASISDKVTRMEEAGQTTMIVSSDGKFVGVLGVADTLRPESQPTLLALHKLGIERLLMLSGDAPRVARAIAKQVGIDEVRAPLMPEGKVQALREFAHHGGIAMVGDGVNDAPALAAASVGISLGGAGSDVALETADVVLMSDDLRRLPYAVGLARRATRVIKQNVAVSIGSGCILMVATLAGWTSMTHTVILHEGTTVLVVINALLLLRYKGDDAR